MPRTRLSIRTTRPLASACDVTIAALLVAGIVLLIEDPLAAQDGRLEVQGHPGAGMTHVGRLPTEAAR